MIFKNYRRLILIDQNQQCDDWCNLVVRLIIRSPWNIWNGILDAIWSNLSNFVQVYSIQGMFRFTI